MPCRERGQIRSFSLGALPCRFNPEPTDMKRKGSAIKRLLFRSLSFKNYLRVLSKMYFVSFDLGLLRDNKLYEYPYFLKHLIRPGDVVIDIGANLGYLSVLFSDLVKAKGKVYAVEPVKPVLTVLRENVRRRPNVEVMPYALGEKNQPIQLGNNTRKNTGFVASGSHFVLEKEAEADTEFDAEMRRGSELFASLKRLDFLKCDIEGYEPMVLREMAPLLVRHRPLMLIETRREKRAEMIEFLGEKGFHAFVLHDGKFYSTDAEEYWDILFVHQEKLERILPFLSLKVKEEMIEEG